MPWSTVEAVQIDRIDQRVLALRLAPDYSDGALGPFLFRFQQAATCRNYAKRAMRPLQAASENLLGTHEAFLATYEKACERLRVPVSERAGVRRVLAAFAGSGGASPTGTHGARTDAVAARGVHADPDVARRDSEALVATYAWQPGRWIGWDRRWAVLMRHTPLSVRRGKAAGDDDDADGGVVFLFKWRSSLKAVGAIPVAPQEACECVLLLACHCQGW